MTEKAGGTLEDPLKEALRLVALADEVVVEAQLWIDAEKSKLPLEFVEKIIKDPENVFTTTPQNTMKYAEFMQRVGAIKEKAESWKDLFFPEVHSLPGS